MSGKNRILFAAFAAKMIFAQTQINLQNQARDVNFSALPSTRSAQTGTVLPPTCSVGAIFVSLSNPAGQNVYVCTATNFWSLQGGTTPNVIAVSASGGMLSIGANCSAASPCNVRVGATVFAFMNGMTAVLSSGSGQAYIYVASSGLLTVGQNLTLSCSGGCTAESGITAFPADSYPIAIWTATNGAWLPGGVDARALLGRDLVDAGAGLTAASSGGSTTLSAPSQEGGFAAAFRGTDVASGMTLYITVPYACTITDWAIGSDGTATIQLWRVADGGTVLPNDGNSLTTNGFALAVGTHIHSTTLGDLSSTSISAFDTFGVNLSAVSSSASHVEFFLGCAR